MSKIINLTGTHIIIYDMVYRSQGKAEVYKVKDNVTNKKEYVVLSNVYLNPIDNIAGLDLFCVNDNLKEIPSPQKGIYYIVLREVMDYYKDRNDLLVYQDNKFLCNGKHKGEKKTNENN